VLVLMLVLVLMPVLVLMLALVPVPVPTMPWGWPKPGELEGLETWLWWSFAPSWAVGSTTSPMKKSLWTDIGIGALHYVHRESRAADVEGLSCRLT
jgi:hypothetical protein